MAGVLAIACTDEDPRRHLDEVDHLERAGFRVAEGRFSFADMSGCCEPDANCWGNNPSTPYGSPLLPPGPGEAPAPDAFWAWGPVPEGFARVFRLRSDEAIVLLGALPPAARYFSYRSYLVDRPGVPGEIVGSLGPSLNHLVISRDRGGASVWEEPVAIVTSLDASVERRVRDALVDSGWAPEHVHGDRITGDVVRPGLGAESDTFMGIVRVGVWDDPAAGEAALEDPDLRVLRVTPDGAESWPEPWPWPWLPTRGTGVPTSGAHAVAALDLAGAVIAANPDRLAVPTLVTPGWVETVQCARDEGTCVGDIRDRWAAQTPGFLLGSDEAILVVGVNHERVGKAVYSNATVQTLQSLRAVATLESPDMPGSAREWLPDDPLVDDLYAWVVARDCSPWPAPCVEVPSTCPGVGEDEWLTILVRAYLEEATGAAPVTEELVPDLGIKLFARGTAP